MVKLKKSALQAGSRRPPRKQTTPTTPGARSTTPRAKAGARRGVRHALTTPGTARRTSGSTPRTRVLRQELLDLLTQGQAHVTVEQALDKLPPDLRGRRPAPDVPSVFEQLEHMRLAQEDILRYTLDPTWKSPAWPEGYWPSPGHVPTPAEWDDAVARFKKDLADVVALARDERRDLTRRLPHGEGRTYLRQVLLVADHNAYHLGQLVQALRLLGAWPA